MSGRDGLVCVGVDRCAALPDAPSMRCSAASVLAVLAIAHGTCALGLNARQVNAPIPPLEWIRPTTTGTRPPPLSDAIVGVDTRGNKLLVFGGRTPSGMFLQPSHVRALRQHSHTLVHRQLLAVDLHPGYAHSCRLGHCFCLHRLAQT